MRFLRDLADVAHRTRGREFCRGRILIDDGRWLDAANREKPDQNQQRKCDWTGEIAPAARFVRQVRSSFAISATEYADAVAANNCAHALCGAGPRRYHRALELMRVRPFSKCPLLKPSSRNSQHRRVGC